MENNNMLTELNAEIKALQRKKDDINRQEILKSSNDHVIFLLKIIDTIKSYDNKYGDSIHHKRLLKELDDLLKVASKRKKKFSDISIRANNALQFYITKYNMDIPAIMDAIGYKKVKGLKGKICCDVVDYLQPTDANRNSDNLISGFKYNAYTITIDNNELISRGVCIAISNTLKNRRLIRDIPEYATAEENAPDAPEMSDEEKFLLEVEDYIDSVRKSIDKIHSQLASYEFTIKYIDIDQWYKAFTDNTDIDISLKYMDFYLRYCNDSLLFIIGLASNFLHYNFIKHELETIGYKATCIKHGIIEYKINILNRELSFMLQL